MTKNSFLALFFIAFGLAAVAFTNPVETIKINTEKSVVSWKGYKVTGEHAGTIAVKNGELTFDNGKLTGGSFDIDMTTITCTDLEGDWAKKLEGHLKSADFFGVENHPTAKFVITKVASRGAAGEYKITGNLSIKDITKEIRFNATASKTGATAEIQLDRTDFDVKYGSGSFFDSLGDKTIYDEFDLNVKLMLN
ncbi:MAG: polyisoprenoid-binding protein YceI [Paraglaciecola sp.]|jgi:polyisoprenoid-binding protein YceI